MLKMIRKLLPAVILAILLCGCTDARTRKLETYRDNMTRFYDNVNAYNTRINEIDASSDSAVADLLQNLDGLNEEFRLLRSYEIPEEFHSISNLTTDAADSMENAVRLYHEAYDDGYQAARVDEARVWYDRANRCIQIILQVLHGEEPTGDDIRITY